MLRRPGLVLLVLLLLGLLGAASASAEAPVRKIVVFRGGVDAVAQDAAIRGATGKPIKSLRLVNATVAHLTPAAAAALARRSDVIRIEDDAVVRGTAPAAPPIVEPGAKPDGVNQGKVKATPTPVPTGQTVPWGIARIKAPEAWSVSRGDTVKVAVLDSGISTSHLDLAVAGGVNEVTPGASYDDDNGHGSHVAGTIAAVDNAFGVVGVGPGIQLYAVKVLDADASGYSSDLIAGLGWSVENGMQVANMSLGSDWHVQALHDAIVAAYNAGITLVAAAGNDGPGPNSVDYPARYPEVLAVTAVNSKDSIARWSSRGPEVDLTAPGVEVYSTFKGTSYATGSGTSMAAPHVSGAAALRMRFDPDRSPAHIAAILKGNADLLPGLSPEQQGAGLVNAQRVVNAPY